MSSYFCVATLEERLKIAKAFHQKVPWQNTSEGLVQEDDPIFTDDYTPIIAFAGSEKTFPGLGVNFDFTKPWYRDSDDIELSPDDFITTVLKEVSNAQT